MWERLLCYVTTESGSSYYCAGVGIAGEAGGVAVVLGAGGVVGIIVLAVGGVAGAAGIALASGVVGAVGAELASGGVISGAAGATSGAVVPVVSVGDGEPGACVGIVAVFSAVLGIVFEGVVVVVGGVAVVLLTVASDVVVGLGFSDFCWQAVIPTTQSPASVASRRCLCICDIPLIKEVNKAVAESARQVKHSILNEACCKASIL